MIKRIFIISSIVLLFPACDQLEQKLGLEDPVKKAAELEADAKAVGSACRQSGRAIEDCYSIYSWLSKAGIYAGWREMDEYMRENKIDTVVPQLPPVEPPRTGKKKRKAADGTESQPEVRLPVPVSPAKQDASNETEQTGPEEKTTTPAGDIPPEKKAEASQTPQAPLKPVETSAEKPTEKAADKPPAK